MMLDIYVLTLALSVGIGMAVTLALLAVSRTERFVGLFNIRGPLEKPRWGGAVFLVTFAVTPFVASALSDNASEFFTPRSDEFLGFVAATALVFAVGFLDDIRLTSPYLRSGVFLAAASAVYAAGYRIDDIGLPVGPDLHLGYGGVFVTLAWIWLTTNAINIVDGRDGVALGVSIFAAVTMAAVAGHSHHPTIALLLLALAGAGLGFLPWNMPPASGYVGDSGAYVMGFVIGALSIRGATGPTDEVFIAVPIIALGFPILDIGLAYVRRLLDRRHPLIGDQDHIHHRLEQVGAGPRGIVVITWSIAALLSLAAIILHYVDSTLVEGAVFAGLLALLFTILQRLGYVVTLWNSHSVVWLRQRVFAPAPSPRD